MTFIALGTIEKLQYHDKGYHKLTVYSPCPETRYLRFCVVKSDLLLNKETGRKFEIGTKVKVVYHVIKGGFPFLNELIPAKSGDCCPLCDKRLEEILSRELYNLDIS